MVPGRSLVQGARSLETRERGAGVFPYQWLFPGPNSKQVLANGRVAMPAAYGTPAGIIPNGSSQSALYTVEQGYRFSLRGLIFGCTTSDFVDGSGDVVFNLTVTAGTAPRVVDYFFNFPFRLGSTAEPFPILGRLEFAELEALSLTVTPVANVTLSSGFGFGALVGHIYPESEAAGLG
jgi:hypothetical protein